MHSLNNWKFGQQQTRYRGFSPPSENFFIEITLLQNPQPMFYRGTARRHLPFDTLIVGWIKQTLFQWMPVPRGLDSTRSTIWLWLSLFFFSYSWWKIRQFVLRDELVIWCYTQNKPQIHIMTLRFCCMYRHGYATACCIQQRITFWLSNIFDNFPYSYLNWRLKITSVSNISAVFQLKGLQTLNAKWSLVGVSNIAPLT